MEERRNIDDEDELLAIGAEVFHGYVLAMDAQGNYNGVGRNNEPFAGALTARPYGFRSYAPVNTGLVLTRSQAGLLVLSQEGKLPSGVSEPLSGETVLYNSQGCKVHLDTNGDINITQKSGRYINLGSAPEFVALASKVHTQLDAIETHTHGPGSFVVGTDPVTGVSGDSSYNAGSVAATEVKAT